jgi:hypothetical protein
MGGIAKGPPGHSPGDEREQDGSEVVRLVATAMAFFFGSFILGAVAAWGVCLAGRKPVSGVIMIGAAVAGLAIVVWRFYSTSRPAT